MKKKIENIFLKKKILIYGLGKSGISSFRFLRNKADIYLFDDLKNTHPKQISKLKLLKIKFDIIIISPGINIFNCKLSKFLKLNKKKIYTDLDVFFTFYKNKCITITGTNGKSTTAKILYEVLKDQKKDVRLIGNIGNPPLNEKKISKNTIFVIEASSYQLDYSQLFSSKYSIILNIKPDHLERHKTLQNYVDAKFKLLDSQSKSCLAFVKSDDLLISRKLKTKKFNCKIVKVNTKKNYNDFLEIKNKYFLTESNRENLSFIIELAKKLKLKNYLLQKTIKNFKGLKYRQQIIIQKKSLTIINDSKSTSFSSSVGILKKDSNILWLLGGIYKKGDKLELKKKDLSNVTAFIYGENKNLFIKQLRSKVKFKNYINLEDAVKNVFSIIKTKRSIKYTILFSPCAASFDSFKNFEERGLYFNRLVKRFMYGK